MRIGMIVCVALALAGSAFAHGTAGTAPHAHEDDLPVRTVRLERYEALGGDFSLTDYNGRTVRLSDYRGRVVLLFFGYTNCADACPLSVARVAQAMQILGDQRQQVRFVFITTDPERDTPARLKEWLGGFDPTFVGLRGTDAEVVAVEKRYASFHIKLPSDGSKDAYEVGHTSRMFLIDQVGAVRYLFTPEQPAEAIVEGVRQVLPPPSWWAQLLNRLTR